jgi:hypothetical protein
MKEPTPDQLKAIVILQMNAAFPIFMGWMRESLTDAFVSMPSDMQKGAAFQLVNMMDHVEGARATLEMIPTQTVKPERGK